METINIGYGHMALGFLLLIIPTYFLYRYRTGLVKDTLIAALRMTVQLFLIGFYLEYLFLWDKLWINLLWILLMIIIASSTALKRTHLPVRTLFMAVSVAFLVSLLVIDFYFLGLGKNLYRPIFHSHQRYDFRQYAIGQRYRSQFVLRLSKQRTTIIPLSVGERRISQRSPNPLHA